MGLKEYRYNGSTFLFDEDAAPEGAELVSNEIDQELAKLEAQNAERHAVEEAERKQREADEETARVAAEAGAREVAEKAEQERKAAEEAKAKQAPAPQNKARAADTK
jgi:hypothetical protein